MTPIQFRILVQSMEDFPELATSSPVFGKTKAQIEAKWDIVAKQQMQLDLQPETDLIGERYVDKLWLKIQNKTKIKMKAIT